jgi:hypothetical protein
VDRSALADDAVAESVARRAGAGWIVRVDLRLLSGDRLEAAGVVRAVSDSASVEPAAFDFVGEPKGPLDLEKRVAAVTLTLARGSGTLAYFERRPLDRTGVQTLAQWIEFGRGLLAQDAQRFAEARDHFAAADFGVADARARIAAMAADPRGPAEVGVDVARIAIQRRELGALGSAGRTAGISPHDRSALTEILGQSGVGPAGIDLSILVSGGAR